MPNFVWTAKGSFGRREVREVVASTAEESKAMLLAEGCTDLVLKEEEIIDAIRAGFVKQGAPLPDAAQRLKARERSRPTVRRLAVQGCLLTAAGAAAVAYWHEPGSPFDLIYKGGIVAAAIISYIWVRIPLLFYERLTKARDWERWEEVLMLVEKLRTLRRIHFIKVPVSELCFCRARALAGLGRLPEALTELQFCEHEPDVPGWLYKSRLAALYTGDHQYSKGLEYRRLAVAEKPIPALFLDLANHLLRYARDPVSARKALEEADRTPLVDFAKPYRLRCRGILAWLEGDAIAAKAELEGALDLLEKSPNLPFREGHMSVAKAYLCCVNAALGDLPKARKLFSEAHAYLVATKEADLLKECEVALGMAGRTS